MTLINNKIIQYKYEYEMTHTERVTTSRNRPLNPHTQPSTPIHQRRQHLGHRGLDMPHLLPPQIIHPNGISIVHIVRLSNESDEFAGMGDAGVISNSDDLIFGGAEEGRREFVVFFVVGRVDVDYDGGGGGHDTFRSGGTRRG